MSRKPHLVFCYPSYLLGGMELLFIRLARYLVEKGFDISYVDYPDGYAAGVLTKMQAIQCIHFMHKPLDLPNDAVVVAPLSAVVETANVFRQRQMRVLLWSVHPEGLANTLKDYGRFQFPKKKPEHYAESLEKLAQRDALYFMDGPNFSVQQEYYGFDIPNPQYLPIFTTATGLKKVSKQTDFTNLGWVGRLSEEKIFPLLHILEQCNMLLVQEPGHKIKFHIIGDGPCKGQLDTFTKHPHLELIFAGTVQNDALDTYLIENVDVLFAMGTSALEGAKQGIPTVLVDYSYQRIALSHRFRWLFESALYSLGNRYQDGKNYQHTLAEIVHLDAVQYGELGEKCYQHYRENHSIASAAEKFIDACHRTQCTIADVQHTAFGKFAWVWRAKQLKAQWKKR